MSWSDYSDKFIKEHPELLDRYPIKVKATMSFEFEAHSDMTDQELVKEALEELKNGAEAQIVLEVINENSDSQKW